jgi:thioredoxin 1
MVKKVENLNDKNFYSVIEKGYAIVDFWAPWCGPCRNFGPTFEKVSEEFDDVKFFKLNTDEDQEVAGNLGIRSIPTVIMFKDGKQVDIKVGGLSEMKLTEWIKDVKKSK